MVAPLEAAKSALDNFKSGDPFWGTWAMQHKNFSNHAKRLFKDDILEQQLARLGELEAIIQKLEKSCQKILTMHNEMVKDD